MSFKVHRRLLASSIRTIHRQRLEIDRRIEEMTGKPCDRGVDDLSNEEFLELVLEVKKRGRKKKSC
jgi:hypothetical protein